jgi:hypothetical protein
LEVIPWEPVAVKGKNEKMVVYEVVSVKQGAESRE